MIKITHWMSSIISSESMVTIQSTYSTLSWYLPT